MTLVDWRTEILNGVLVHQRLAELDTARLWSYHLPEVGASEQEISAAEATLGYRLDPQFRYFLSFANGWQSFYQDVDIIGTRELLGGGVMKKAQEQLAAIDNSSFQNDVGMGLDDVVPIAASARQPDLFLLGLPHSPQPGAVMWFAGYLVERFAGFDEFYLSMLDYNRRQIAKFEGRV